MQLPIDGGAVFGGPDARYRYRLWRRWDGDKPLLGFVLCNPSRAGGLVDGKLQSDPTVDRLIDIADMDGAGGFLLVNLLAHVEPKSGRLRGENLDGPENQEHLDAIVESGYKVVVGWGASKLLRDRSRRLLDALHDRRLWCVGVNARSVTPMHPLQRGPKLLKLVEYVPESRQAVRHDPAAPRRNWATERTP